MPKCRSRGPSAPMTPSKKDNLYYNSSKRDKERDKAGKERTVTAAVSERLKTVVRRLPPNLPEEVFWQSVQQWVTDETVIWRAFHPGKLKKKINKENIPSRAYIAFKNEEAMAHFSREYDGHVFRDKQGNESHAVVEFAPYQKIPSEKKKADARNATIEKDEDYISFIASLNEPANSDPVSIETLMAANQAPPMPKTTPLLEALKAEKSATRDKEAILRNHAHYKDLTVLTSVNAMRSANVAAATASSVKDDSGKKKGLAANQLKEGEFGRKGKKAQAAAQAAVAKHQQTVVATSAKKEPAPPTKPSWAARQQAAAAKIVEAAPATMVAAHVGAAAAASRRGRPAIGITRQLQAALSQVGAAAVERKRREQEKEAATADLSSNVDNNGSAAEGPSEKGKEPELGAAPASPIFGKEDKAKSLPSSPRRDRKKKEKSGHHSDANQKVPSIMQRPEGVPPLAMQRDVPGQILPGPAQVQTTAFNYSGSDVAPPVFVGGPVFRGGPRRGRGRGRGGPIHRGG